MAERLEGMSSPVAGAEVRLGQYVVLEELPGGGMARLYRARHASLGRVVVLKELHPRYRDDPSMRERFRREAEVATSLAHDHIVRGYEFWEETGRAFLALEFVDGPDAKSLLERVGRLSAAAAVALGAQICDALAYAHGRGLIHRDLKPSNILVAADGRAKLGDFGIAVLPDSSALTQTGHAPGTPAYMSPEQIQGDPLTPVSDLFALGVVLYEVCSGVRPFATSGERSVARQILTSEPQSPRAIAKEIPRTLEKVILRAMKPRPGERYADALSLQAALLEAVPLTGAQARKALADLVAAARRPRRSHSGKALPPARPARAARLLVTAAMTTMVALAVPGWHRWHTQGQISPLPAAPLTPAPTAPLPTAGSPVPPPASASAPVPVPSGPGSPPPTHTVQPGETLGAIALRYYREARHSSLLAAANRLDPRAPLRAGQALRIPSGEPYEVRPGESVTRIAERALGDSRRSWVLLELNGLKDPDRLLPGQTLRLPIRTIHEVRRGETLAAIAERYYGSPTLAGRIARYNFLPEGAAPLEGTRLEVPLLPPAAPGG